MNKLSLSSIRYFIFGSIKLYLKYLFGFKFNKSDSDIYFIISEYDYLFFSGVSDD